MAGEAEAAAAAAAAGPWHQGVDAEIVGHWQNKGWDATKPENIAIEATKAAREAQKFVGAPPERLIRLPEKPDDKAGWDAVHQRLGAPADPKDYDFSAVTDAKLADTLRTTAAAARLSKDAASAVSAAVVKHLDGVKAEETAVHTAKLAEERAALAKQWAANPDVNLLHAKTGAQKLGLAPEDVDALEKVVGYSKTMEALRRVGAMGGEDKFVEGGKPGDVTTAPGAAARKAELMADKDWSKRLLSGDTAALREWTALEHIIATAA